MSIAPTFLDRVLRPLVRLAIARGVLFPDLAQCLRRLYVEAAVARGQGRVTDSRISVLTGLQRREIARLRSDADPTLSPSNPHLARLVARWSATWPEQPLDRRGPAPSFEALAREIRQDVHPRTMLEHLLDTGTVALDGDRVVLLKTAYVPGQGTEAQLEYLIANLGDHAATAVENVLDDAARFERAVHYNGLDDASLARLRAEFASQQQTFLTRINALAQQLQDEAPQGSTGRFRAGAYYFDEGKDAS